MSNTVTAALATLAGLQDVKSDKLLSLELETKHADPWAR